MLGIKFLVQFVELKIQFRYLLPQLGVPKLLENVVSKKVRIAMNVTSAMETEVHRSDIVSCTN